MASDECAEPLDSQRLFTLLYDGLRAYARSRMARERPNHTLQATAVVNELWIRLEAQGRTREWDSRGQFFAAMARSIRQILVDYARARNAAKRGGGILHQPIDEVELVAESETMDLVELDRALDALESVDPLAAQVVTLRYFGGLTIPEIARELDCSPRMVDRLWSAARRWLLVELEGNGRDWIATVGSR